jgi:hypothetical protein
MMKNPRKTSTLAETSIQGGHLYFEDARQCHVDDPQFSDIIGDGYTKSIRVVSLDYDWERKVYLDYTTTVTEQINVEMTLRLEKRRNSFVWYAYRRVHGTLFKKYVGLSENVTQQRLLDIAKGMPSK